MIRLLPLALLILTTPAMADVIFSCSESNDLFQALTPRPARTNTPLEAAERARDNDSIFILSTDYPAQTTDIPAQFWDTVRAKKLHLYLEYPTSVPGHTFGPPTGTDWQRQVITSDAFGPTLAPMRILQQHGCTYLPTTAKDPWLVVARVAGYDQAVYGLPATAAPLLFPANERRWLIATTKLSHFVTGRYAPTADWKTLWQTILKKVAPDDQFALNWTPLVRPAYAKDQPLPADFERQAFVAYADWVPKSRLLISAERAPEVRRLLAGGAEVTEPAANAGPADGSQGILEGYSSAVRADGSQPQRLPLRADCNAEIAMVMALDHAIRARDTSKTVATNLLNYVYKTSGLCAGERGDPKHPAFGLIAWGDVAPAWLVGNYGDDNARVLLATMLGAAALETSEFDVPLLRGLLANLRTTGKLGFRGDRVDVPALAQHGWRHFHDAETVNYAPHFESYLWACYLWAHARTGEAEFLDKTKTAIRMTMAAYPGQWRWGDNIERARMLLCLAWLVRVEDTPEHRGWLKRVADDLLACQHESGAIQERLRDTGGGHYQIPQSNEAYGTGETPLVQSNADPASDQLYTTGFALLALHEAVGATGDAGLKKAEDKLAEYLCRIQVRAGGPLDYLDGTWFRAFDYGRWDYWASSADLGWGVWSVEAGWAQAWTAATLALRERGTTFWDFTRSTSLRAAMPGVKSEMLQNDGLPYRR